MKKVHIILSNIRSIDKIIIQNLEDRLNLFTISISEEIREVLKTETELSINIKKYIDKGELILDWIFNKIIDNRINLIQSNIQIIRYPRDKNQFLSLKELLKSKGFIIEQIWFLKIADIEKFIQFNKETQKDNPYIIKFGFNEDTLTTNYSNSSKQFNEIQEFISNDKLTTTEYPFENIESQIEKSITLYIANRVYLSPWSVAHRTPKVD